MKDVVHFYRGESAAGTTEVFCGSDLRPTDGGLLGQPFTFHFEKVTCLECLKEVPRAVQRLN